VPYQPTLYRRLAAGAIALLTLLPACQASSHTPPETQRQRKATVLAQLKRAEAERNSPAYGQRDDVLAYARDLASRQPQLELAWIEATLAQARFQPQVAKLIMPPTVGVIKDWSAYRARFIEPNRVQAGLAFWRNNERWLRAAESAWGVPASVVVGIVGVETFYGRITGNFRVIDALATLSFDFPSGRSDRSAFFRQELEQLLVLAQRDKLDLSSLRGSYAGALGWPQFMPSSWLKYGQDFDDDGRIDLQNSMADVIGSVAHYLAAHGWQPGMPTHYAVVPPADLAQRARLLVPDICPSFTAAEMMQAGAQLPEAAQRHADALALVKLENGGDEPSYIAGTQNFWVVTRYNQSSYYALAVIELGEAVAALREQERADAAAASAVPAASGAASTSH
jgi:membrane-bound lytic murein transglycosylase B